MAAIKFNIYKLLERSNSVSFQLQSRDNKNKRLVWVEPGTKKNHAMRYSRNHDSPFIEHQDDTAILEPIVFENGILTVPETNPALIEFLKIHPDNKANGGYKFYVQDLIADAEKEYREIERAADAMQYARTMPIEKMKAIARVHTSADVNTLSEVELKRNIIVLARNSPELFMEYLDNKDLDLNNLAERAFEEGILTFRAGKDIHFNLADNKKKIITVPIGMEKAEALAQWLITNSGKDFYDYLKDLFSED